jgi:hypothetical protein
VTDAPTPRPDAPVPPAAPPAPPYVANSHPGGVPPLTPPVVPPYARGYAQQPYPGAPPVWTTPPPTGGTKVLAGIALGLAIFGAVVSIIPFGIVVSWIFLLAAIVLAIVALVRRAGGRGMSISALIVSGAGILIAIAWGVGFSLLGSWFGSSVDSGYDDDTYTDDSGYVVLGVEAGTGGASRDDALAYGTAVTVVDSTTGTAVWELTVGAPVDATAGATDGAPLNGAYLAVPVEITNLTDETIALATEYEYAPYAWMLTGDGGRLDAAYIPGSYEDFPQIWDLGDIAPGDSVTYWEAFDATPAVLDTGYLVLEFDSGEDVYWGPVSAQ